MTRKERIYEFMKSEGYVPLMQEELMLMLDVPKEAADEFDGILKELLNEGRIIKSRKGRFCVNTDKNVISGTFRGNDRGFGFVLLDGGDDIYISKENSGGAIDGDSVIIKLFPETGGERRREGKVLKVTKRANDTFLCTFRKKGSKLFAIPDEKRISKYIKIDKKHTLGAVNGQKVMAKITQYSKDSSDPSGVITEVLGFASDPKTSFKGVLRIFGLPEDFEDEVLKEARKVPEKIAGNEIGKRRDMRDSLIITIDGADAKDLDDAVSVTETESGNFILSVHIADVSHYVKQGGKIFKEALKRGTSVYLAGGVVPMLPKELSNGICSLNEQKDRLTLSVDMEITPKGEIISHEIYKAVIRTAHRMTYEDVTKILNGNKKLVSEFADIVPMLKIMKKLAEILKKRRFSAGSIDFNFPETKIEFDEDGFVTDVHPYEYTISNSIIEEFMLAANKTVAEHYFWLETPFVYRVHESPSEEKMLELMRLMSIFDCRIKGSADGVHPKALQQVLESIKGQPHERIIGTVMLRSMMKAKYSTSCDGHFGLAEKYYCHFTSPIRRLSDLAVHTVISADLAGEDKDFSEFTKIAAANASDREIIAEEAERTSKKLKIAEYMYDYIGACFDGIISSTTKWGFYVELENGVEGRVSVADLDDDYYNFIENSYSLVGERTGKTYKIGDKITVEVADSNPTTGEIDFVPADE